MQPNPNHNAPDLSDLTQTWLNLKETEERAKRERTLIERELFPHCDTVDEGARTTELDDGTKITVQCRINRQFDFRAFEEMRGHLPEELIPLKLTEVLDPQKLKSIQVTSPDTYAKLQRYLTSKPGKPTFNIKPGVSA